MEGRRATAQECLDRAHHAIHLVKSTCRWL
jgi:hypothetical protein